MPPAPPRRSPRLNQPAPPPPSLGHIRSLHATAAYADSVQGVIPDSIADVCFTGEQALSWYEAALFQLQPAISEMECEYYREAHLAECCKATQSWVEVKTQLGPRVIRVPSSSKAVNKSHEREEWIAADRKALDVILAMPGNTLVPRQEALDQGIPIAKCVTARRVKVDQATGELAAENAFKSRHASDYNRGKPQPLIEGLPFFAACADEITVKLFLAVAAILDRNLTKGDVSNAYLHGKRRDTRAGYTELPDTLQQVDDQNRPLCIRAETPLWGEGGAGADWAHVFIKTLLEIGWVRDECVPCLFHFETADGDAQLITCVDDFLISEPTGSYRIADETIRLLTAAFGGVTSEREPRAYTGYKIERDRKRKLVTLSMPQKIEEAVNEYYPELLSKETRPSPGNAIKEVEALADQLRLCPLTPGQKLSAMAKRNQRAIGAIKFFEKVLPSISLPTHRLSCVMSNPDGEAVTKVVNAVLAHAYDNRHVGLTYGGVDECPRLTANLSVDMRLADGAPKQLEVFGDATWGLFSIYGLLVTFAGAAVFHQTKRIATICDCSQRSESIPTSKGSEVAEYARNVLRGLGMPCEEPTLIGTDNRANMLVARNAGSAKASRHFLRQYYTVRQKQERGIVDVRHVPDTDNPSDFLTKWLKAEKRLVSMDYSTGHRRRGRIVMFATR